MATMIPDYAVAPGAGRTAERMLYDAFKRSLPEDFFVYHGLHYIEGGTATEGEADFLVVHREFGFLVVECKGSGVTRNRSGQWKRVYANGRADTLKVSPFEQAQRHVHDLVTLLKPRIAASLGVQPRGSEFPFTFGHAVAFPRASLEGMNLPLDVSREIVFGEEDLDSIGAKVRTALAFWRGHRRPPTPLEPAAFRHFRRHILHPELRIVPSLGARLRGGARTFHRLGEEQARMLSGAFINRRLRVSGGAGTGKTVLALESARRFATTPGEVRTVLLLCFNKHLGRYLAGCVGDMGLADGQVQALHFHSLCIRAYGRLGREAVFPSATDPEASRSFWEVEAPMALLEALEAGVEGRYDVVIIDEGQDFLDDWWVVIAELLADPDESRLLIFYDTSQDIFERGGKIPDCPAAFQLQFNFRNTRRITEVVKRLGAVKMEAHPDCPDGDPPVVHQGGRPAKTLRQLEELVDRLVKREGVEPDQIAILTPHSRRNSVLEGVEQLGGFPLADDPLDRAGSLLHSTIRGFKGLESEVVIVADIDPDDPLCSTLDRYVAASRARQILHVFTKGDWLAGAQPDSS